jgi:phosphatidate phosphatase APP1
MPIVIPSPGSSTSSAQTVPTQQVYDYLLDTKGNAVKGAQVTVTLDAADATTITPQVLLSAVAVTATTDSNGFWTVNLVPNANITPANSTYSVQVPGYDAYQISIPSAGGPFQSTSSTVLVT